MKPPQASLSGSSAKEDAPAAVSLRVTTLKKRSDFQRASRARRIATPGFILQQRRRFCGSIEGVRIGYTCSKKVGNAVARNRAKRRLREIARLSLPDLGREGFDYVLIGRAEKTAALPFEQLLGDMRAALKKLNETDT
jgi:ribonuclease P protein component